MKDIKIEEIKIVISYNPNETTTAFDSVIQRVYDAQDNENYKVLAYSNPIEYKITKEK